LRADDVRWGSGTPPATGTPVGVRIRHRHPLVAGRITRCGTRDADVTFEGDGPLVTPGQAAVFYRGDVVLGGGWTAGALAACAPPSRSSRWAARSTATIPRPSPIACGARAARWSRAASRPTS